MIAVFLSFVGSPIPSLKMLGLGLATAIAIDATLIRMVLVPATMSLLGDANWWLPRWLDKALPVVDIEADADVTTGVSDTDTAAPRAEELVPR
jgi:putative drug exporter of the RND superfamily